VVEGPVDHGGIKQRRLDGVEDGVVGIDHRRDQGVGADARASLAGVAESAAIRCIETAVASHWRWRS
jgi:hypothetical protein